MPKAKPIQMLLIMKAGDIPNESTVTKSKDGVEFMLRDTVIVWSEVDGEDRKRELKSEGGKFLCGGRNGDINAIPDHKLLHWKVTPQVLHELLDDGHFYECDEDDF